MKESDIEAKLVRGVKALGGIAYKFISPGHPGVPDRLVVLPGGKVIFVELKTEIGRLSKVQLYECGQLEARGCEVAVLYGLNAVKYFLMECREEMDDCVSE